MSEANTTLSVLIKPEGDSLTAFLQGPDETFTELNHMLDDTRADKEKHANGELFSLDQLKTIRLRVLRAEHAIDVFKRLRSSNKHINTATLVFAINVRLLTAILNEMTERGEIPPEGRGRGHGTILRDLQISNHTIAQGRKLLNFSEDEIEERINALGANGPVYKMTLLRNLASSGQSTRGRLEEAPPEKKEDDQSELLALTRLMDRMEENPSYFMQARFAQEPQFTLRTQDLAMLNNCIDCWEAVRDVLSRQKRTLERS
jgi:hypothetical protein